MPPPFPRDQVFSDPEHMKSSIAGRPCPQDAFTADALNDSNQETPDHQRIRGLIRWQGLIDSRFEIAIPL
jgi:hypothetical protein